MSEAHNYYKNIKMHVFRCIIIGFKQKYGHKPSRSVDMNMQCNSDFTAKIGQYFVDHR